MKLSQILPLVVVGGALATSLVAWEKPAQAINFTFSFTNTTGNVNGTVKGTIYGLIDNATSSATQVTLDSYPSALGTLNDSTNILSWDAEPSTNSFSVVNGTIISSNLQYYGYGGAGICIGGDSQCLFDGGLTFDFGDNSVGNGASPTYAVPVPFDISPGAILPTIPILALMYLWKQSRNRMALKTINNPDVTVSTYRQVG
ncbi:MAG: hypothetical protein ACK5QV_00905 [Dolichospermum sp.]